MKNMKKILILTTIIALTAFLSCDMFQDLYAAPLPGGFAPPNGILNYIKQGGSWSEDITLEDVHGLGLATDYTGRLYIISSSEDKLYYTDDKGQTITELYAFDDSPEKVQIITR